jgi:choline dehydrogenase-like flavoprotein
VHVAEAQRSGLCDVFTETVARRIDRNAAGDVKSIHVATLDKREREVTGTHYVIAAHTVESARLLLLSKFGNHSDQVGRNFMEHIYTDAGGSLPGKNAHPFRVGYEVLESKSYYTGPDRHERGGIKLEFTFERDPLQDMEGMRTWGAAMARYDRESYGQWVGIECETEHLPNPDSRVSLDPKVVDMFGDPVPHMRLAFSDLDRRTQSRSSEIMLHLLAEAGVKDAVANPVSAWSFGAHHMGTCRMAADPDQGVVDKNCQVHGVPNLYVVGGSVFPTAGALQPSLTIAALALRAADHLWPD